MELSAALFEWRLARRLGMEENCTAAAVSPSVSSGWDAEQVSEFLARELDRDRRTMERLVIVGGGGHAKVIIDIFEETRTFELAGCTSRSGSSPVSGLPVLGDDDILPRLYSEGIRHAFVALGNNRVRADVTARLRDAGFRLANAVSRHAVISPRARLGEGVAVMPGAIINAASEIGDGAIVNTGATVDHDCRIGAYAHIAPGVNLCGCVTVGEGAFVGAGSHVIPGISIGAWTTVGAGAAVVRNLPDGVTAVGVPARVRDRKA